MATNIFCKCAPLIRTNIGACGSLTTCNATAPTLASELDQLYMKDGRYRLLEALFMTQLEGKMCGVQQKGLRDFLVAQARDVRKAIQLDSQERSLIKVRPFLLMRQKSPINNNYWRVIGVSDRGGGQFWIDVSSAHGIPNDGRFFPGGTRIYIEYETAGGSKRWWQAVVNSAGEIANGIRIACTAQNDGSAFGSAGNPTVGAILHRGTANVGKTESFCDDEPGLISTKLTEFWIEHTRFTLCSSSDYDEFRKLVLQNNPLFEQFLDLPEVEENRQRTESFWQRWTNNLFFGKPISAHQNINEYTQLPQITNYVSAANIGFGGGRCAGYKANVVGWIEQLKKCGRFYDAQGQKLNLWSLMDAIYKLMRVRMSVGSAAATNIDLVTDSTTADLIDRGFMLLYKEASADTLRTTVDVTSGKNDTFGWQFKSYRLRGKCSGVTLNVITDVALDDLLSEWTEIGKPNQGRYIFLFDWTGIYPGIIETNRISSVVGDRNRLAEIEPGFACVEETVTQRVTLTGVTYSAIMECPLANLCIVNFSGEVPEHSVSASRPDYAPKSGEAYCY